MRVRAVLLAAGLGRRLRPLTEFLPKPLLPLAGRSVAGHTLARLAEAGCEGVAVNLHHLGDEIRAHLGATWSGIPLTYSEEPEILGTLGALVPLREFLRPADLVVVINGDSFCHWPLRWFIRRHRGSGAAATLLLSTRADCESFGGGVGVDEGGRIVSLRPGGRRGAVDHRRVFAGAHVFSPRLLEALEKSPADFVDHLYEPLLARGVELRGLETSRPWHDLGTPRRYLEAALAAARSWPRLLQGGGWVASGARVDGAATVRASAVEAGATVDAEAAVVRSLVLPGARVGSRCRVLGSIIGPGVSLPAGSSVESRMVTPARPDTAPRPQDSVMSRLVYSPLD